MRRLPGSHAPNIKNRSSKQLSKLTKIRPFWRSMSNTVLLEIAKSDAKNNSAYRFAQKELDRRSRKVK